MIAVDRLRYCFGCIQTRSAVSLSTHYSAFKLISQYRALKIFSEKLYVPFQNVQYCSTLHVDLHSAVLDLLKVHNPQINGKYGWPTVFRKILLNIRTTRY